MTQPLSISAEEVSYVTNGNLEGFWYSRLQKRDPVARIGYALWVSDTEKLKAATRPSGITRDLPTGSSWPDLP